MCLYLKKLYTIKKANTDQPKIIITLSLLKQKSCPIKIIIKAKKKPNHA